MSAKYIKSDLLKMINSGRTLKEMGFHYGVSRQRMYQVLGELGITTPERERKSQLHNWTEKEKWLWKTLTTRFPNNKKIAKLEFLKAVICPDICPVLNIPLDYSFGKVIRGDNSPSIDQIKPGEGYSKENCIVISWRANRIKNDGTPEEHLKIYNYYSSLTK